MIPTASMSSTLVTILRSSERLQLHEDQNSGISGRRTREATPANLQAISSICYQDANMADQPSS
jgi:hypothetical protein